MPKDKTTAEKAQEVKDRAEEAGNTPRNPGRLTRQEKREKK